MNPKTTPKGLEELLRAYVRTSNSVVLKTTLFFFFSYQFCMSHWSKTCFCQKRARNHTNALLGSWVQPAVGHVFQ